MDNRIEGEKVIFNRLLWPEQTKGEEAVDESGLRCELGEYAFTPSGHGDFKLPEKYSFFIRLFGRGVRPSQYTSSQKTERK